MAASQLSSKIKVLASLILLIVMVLGFKIGFSYFNRESEGILSQSEINNIRTLLTEECLKQEETSLNKGNNLDEDLDWIKNKAPEFCKCVSLRIYSLVLQENSMKELLARREKKEFNQRVLGVLKSDKSKDVTDFCLAKAQKMPSPKRAVASEARK